MVRCHYFRGNRSEEVLVFVIYFEGVVSWVDIYRDVSSDLNVKISVDKISMRYSSLCVDIESFGEMTGGYTGEVRKTGSFIISSFFFDGGGVDIDCSGGFSSV